MTETQNVHWNLSEFLLCNPFYLCSQFIQCNVVAHSKASLIKKAADSGGTRGRQKRVNIDNILARVFGSYFGLCEWSPLSHQNFREELEETQIILTSAHKNTYGRDYEFIL